MNKTLFFLLLSVWLCSCSKKEACVDVQVDFDQVNNLMIDTTRLIELETNDSSLLFDICEMEILDSTIFIFSRDRICAFDMSGNYKGNVSQKGHGNNEYMQIGNIFVEDGCLCFYDSKLLKIFRYSSDRVFLEKKNVSVDHAGKEATFPAKLLPCGKEYISVNAFAGDGRVLPAMCYWSKDFRNFRPVGGHKKRQSLSLSDEVCVDSHNRVLYWESLVDTLYVVRDQNLVALYHIDFGEKSLPAHLAHKTFFEKVEYINTELYPNHKDFGGMVRFYQVGTGKIYFSCLMKDFETHLCVLDESSLETKVFRLISENNRYKVMSFMRLIGDKIYVEVHDTSQPSANPYLYVIPIEQLER